MERSRPPGEVEEARISGASPGRPVSPLWVLGTFAFLVLLLGLLGMLFAPQGAVLDPAEVEALMFTSVSDSLPYGLMLAEARRLPTGAVVLKYATLGEPSDGPESMTMIEFPAQRAESVLEEQFQKLRFDSAGSGMGGRGRGRGHGGKGGASKKPKLQDAGFLDWQGYSANYARLRHPAPDESSDGPSDDSSGASTPRTYDTVRLNLSTGGRCLIAYVRFPLGVEGTPEAAAELVGAFVPR